MTTITPIQIILLIIMFDPLKSPIIIVTVYIALYTLPRIFFSYTPITIIMFFITVITN